MDVKATPPLEEHERRALLVALERVDVGACGEGPYRHAWRLAALCEAALDDDAEPGYAFSPRSTRGATRA